MKLRFICNYRILEIVQCTEIELKQIEIIATAEWIQFNGSKREKKSKCHLLNYQYLPGGFWFMILKLRQNDYVVEIEGLKDFIRTIDVDEYDEWINGLDLKYQPKWYQIRGSFLALKYPISRGEFATSAGKSFILYLIQRYLIEHLLAPHENVLIVVPSVLLVGQLAKDFNEYQLDGLCVPDEIYGGSRRRNKASRIVIGNVDSLTNYDADFFDQFGAILYDEAHKLKTVGYRQLIDYLSQKQLKSIYGLSGTFYDTGTHEDLIAEAISGPVVFRVGAADLIEEGSITPIRVSCLKMIHSREVSEEYYNHEKCQSSSCRADFETKFIMKQIPRFMKIFSIVKAIKYNQLLLFKSRKYCSVFHQFLKIRLPDHHVLTIHGDVDDKKRRFIKEFTELHTNVIICATYGTMSTGVSINNLSTLHQVESYKSFILIRQSIGRILRLHPTKKEAHCIDYCDVFKRYDKEWGGPKRHNISVNHAKIRQSIYDDQKFPWSETTINL